MLAAALSRGVGKIAFYYSCEFKSDHVTAMNQLDRLSQNKVQTNKCKSHYMQNKQLYRKLLNNISTNNNI
jgi:hypothetical protein